MSLYSTFKYGTDVKYGVGVATGNLLWTFIVMWDGEWWSSNEAYQRMIDLTVNRGRRSLLAAGGKGLESFGVGEAVGIFDNEDGRFDPYNADSPIYPNVSPGKFARIAVRDDSTGTDYSIMRGIVDDIQPIKQGDKELVRIVVKDGFQWLKDRVINLGLNQTLNKSYAPFAIIEDTDWPFDEWGQSIISDTTKQDYWWAWNQNALNALDEWNKAEWSVAFHDRDGDFAWRPRTHTRDRIISLSQDEILRDIGRPQPWEVVRNIIRVYSSPKILDVVGATLWALQTVPAILDGATFFIEPIFKYSTWLPCGSSVVFNYTVNTQADGGGADLTAGCDLVFDAQIGEGARLWLTNNSGSDGYIILFNAVGDAIYPPSIDIREVEDTVSQDDYGARSLVNDSRWIEDTEYAQTQATWLLANAKAPRMLPIIQMEDRLANQFTPDLYDEIILRVPKVGIRHVFRVGHIKHQWLSDNGQSVRSTMRLEPFLIDGLDTSDDAHHGCLLTRTAPRTVNHNTLSTVSWNEELFDTGYHAPGATTFAIPPSLPGYYRIWAHVRWEADAGATGRRILYIWRTPGATYGNELARHEVSAPTIAFNQYIETTRFLDKNDLVQIYVYQNSGGALDIEEEDSPYTPLFGIQFLGA